MKKMIQKISLIACASVLSTLIQVQAADLPAYNATYRINAYGKVGTATRTLKKSGNTYHYAVKGTAAGIASLNQSATFSLSGTKITPINSSLSAKILGVGNTHNISFNNNTKTAISMYKNKSTALRMNGQAYDDLSLEAQIRQELMNGKFSGTYQLVKKNSIETIRFKKSGNSKITVPAGTYEVIRIDRIHDDKARLTSFWLAPDLDYLPIKVSQTNDGRTISMELTQRN
ncbi:DUF3108 domain-containing protein [Moraxella sp. Tifton1]|uniref:DUF3108 domain-containing protein n=1 Tax=Moraxella oculi TaxID=2940516 RepID=UPI0020125FDF|nr:DUF3108 domain-containing protein [Moraxella sp. Tifton1]MCL1623264.1 DUF3108 domain-containing protein [Moraxella sp. Tifton1]